MPTELSRLPSSFPSPNSSAARGLIFVKAFSCFLAKGIESAHSASSSRRLLAWLFSESRVVLFVGRLYSGAKALDDLSVDSSLFFFAKRASASALFLFLSLLALLSLGLMSLAWPRLMTRVVVFFVDPLGLG